MIVELAIADAFGMPFEYTGKIINYIGGYGTHPRYPVKNGHYGDDTQMSLAIAEMMLSDKEWNDENLADAFYNCYARDRRGGYAHRFAQFLEEVKSGKEFLEKIKPDSEKSGSAMRSVPLGLYPDINEVKRKAIVQAGITHNTEKGLLNSMAVALSTHYYTYNLGPKLDLYYFLEQHGLQEWTKLWDKKVGSKGHDSVCAALTTVLINDNMLDILKDAVNYTGDVDTVACIAIGIASQCSDIENNLPYHLYSGLENGTYGRDYLIDLDKKLKIKFPNLKLSIPYENFDKEIELPSTTILPISEETQVPSNTQGNLFEQ
jgi:ADP-ribosylglycohydrolase